MGIICPIGDIFCYFFNECENCEIFYTPIRNEEKNASLNRIQPNSVPILLPSPSPGPHYKVHCTSDSLRVDLVKHEDVSDIYLQHLKDYPGRCLTADHPTEASLSRCLLYIYFLFSLNRPLGRFNQPVVMSVCLSFCVFVPFDGTQNRVDWRLLVKESYIRHKDFLRPDFSVCHAQTAPLISEIG